MANMLKNMQNERKSNPLQRRRATFCVLVMISIAFISFIIISTVLSSKNIGTYNEEEKTMTIRESFLDRSVLAEVTLKSPQLNYVIRGKNRLVAEFTMNNIE